MSEKFYRFKNAEGQKYWLPANNEEDLKRKAEKIFKIAEVFEITEVERKRLVKNKTELTAGSTNDYSTNVLRRQSSSLRKPSKKRTKVQGIF